MLLPRESKPASAGTQRRIPKAFETLAVKLYRWREAQRSSGVTGLVERIISLDALKHTESLQRFVRALAALSGQLPENNKEA